MQHLTSTRQKWSDSMEELWRSVKGYEGLYEVSNFGNVRSLDRTIKRGQGYAIKEGRVLTPFYEEKKGYYQVRLSKDGKNKTYRIHERMARKEAICP